MKIATRNIVREIDSITIKKYGIPGLILMENAGRAVANVILSEYPEAQRIAVFCGGGNNGGDGFVIARHLISAGKKVTTYLLINRKDYRGDARINLNSLLKLTKDIKRLKSNFSNYEKSDLVVDAIFGTGLDREVKGNLKKIISRINSLRVPRVSVDLPSGLDSDKGTPLGTAVKADKTVTFIIPKLGMTIHPGVEYTGGLYISDITTPKKLEGKIKFELITFARCRSIVKERAADSHKGTYGHSLIIAGSRGKTGAAALCAHSAVRSGSGLVTIGAPASVMKSIEEKTVESMSAAISDGGKGNFSESSLNDTLALLESKTSVAIGPGISVTPDTEKFLLALLKKVKVPVVADADAISIIAKNKDILTKIRTPVILTPHPGEMARLAETTSSEIQINRIDHAMEFAVNYGCYLILKGARSVVATPKGNIFVNPTGNPGMSSGGMGDILTGILAGLLSQKYTPEESCILGTFVHGLSGDMVAEDIGLAGITASDVANKVPSSINRIHLQEKEPFFEIIR